MKIRKSNPGAVNHFEDDTECDQKVVNFQPVDPGCRKW